MATRRYRPAIIEPGARRFDDTGPRTRALSTWVASLSRTSGVEPEPPGDPTGSDTSGILTGGRHDSQIDSPCRGGHCGEPIRIRARGPTRKRRREFGDGGWGKVSGGE